jgi:hypothetical protein
MVVLGRRAERVIPKINSTAETLRHELMAGIPISDLQTCMKVLASIRDRADKNDRFRSHGKGASVRRLARRNGQTKRGDSIPRKGAIRRGPNES